MLRKMETSFGPDQEDPIDFDKELEDDILEQAEKAVPLNRFPSGPNGFEEDTTDNESCVTDSYEEALSYGATAIIVGNNRFDDAHSDMDELDTQSSAASKKIESFTHSDTLYMNYNHSSYLLNIKHQTKPYYDQLTHKMVNLSFSLPANINRYDKDWVDDCEISLHYEKIDTRVCSAPIIRVSMKEANNAVTSKDIEKRSKSAPAVKLGDNFAQFITDNISNNNIDYDNISRLSHANSHNLNNDYNNIDGMDINSSPVNDSNLKQSDSKKISNLKKPTAEIFILGEVENHFPQDKCTVCTLPGEVIEDTQAKDAFKVSRVRYEREDEKRVSCFYKYFWIKPLDICCTCLGTLYD